jgi:hypothetical protein
MPEPRRYRDRENRQMRQHAPPVPKCGCAKCEER